MSGDATSPVKKMYMTKSPSVMPPDRMARPPTTIMMTPIAPTMTMENAEMAATPVTDWAMFRNNRCAPLANTKSSRRSAV